MPSRLSSSGGAGDQRAHVAHHDRTDRDLIEPPALRREPFKLDKRFLAAFTTAIENYGIERLQEPETYKPPKRLLDLIARELTR